MTSATIQRPQPEISYSDVAVTITNHRTWADAVISYRGRPIGFATYLPIRNVRSTVPEILDDIDGTASLSTYAWFGKFWGLDLAPCMDNDQINQQVFEVACGRYNPVQDVF
jgi:hypothetical protein